MKIDTIDTSKPKIGLISKRGQYVGNGNGKINNELNIILIFKKERKITNIFKMPWLRWFGHLGKLPESKLTKQVMQRDKTRREKEEEPRESN